MPRSPLPNRRTETDLLLDTWNPHDHLQMNAVVAACALVAQADGWVTPEERNTMVQRMRHSPLVTMFGIDEVIVAFDSLNARFDRDLDDGEAVAEAMIGELRGQPRPSRLLIDTACSVAEADGGFDAEERGAIVRLCELLDLEPGDFDLTGAPAARR